MRIAILGTGHIGGALARLWTANKHTVTLGVRNESKVTEAVRQFPGAKADLIASAATGAEVVLLAVPWGASREVLLQAGNLSGKVLIDTTNPLGPDLRGLALERNLSAAEWVQQWQPDAFVVKAFNSLGAAYLGNAQIDAVSADGFYCGDGDRAKAVTAELIGQAGLNPVDLGPLQNARHLESLAVLWIDMAVHRRLPGRFAFNLISEKTQSTARA